MNRVWSVVFLIGTVIFGVLSCYVWFADGQTVSEGVSGDGLQSELVSGLVLDVTDVYGHTTSFSNNGFSVWPYSIKDADTNKDVDEIAVHFWSQLFADNTVSSWKIYGKLYTELYRSSEVVPVTYAPMYFEETGGSWVDKEKKELECTPISWTALQAVAQQYGEGTYVLQFLGNATIDVTFSDGSRDIRESVAPAISWSFVFASDSSSSSGYSILNSQFDVTNAVSAYSLSGGFAASTGLPTWSLHVLFPLAAAFCFVIALAVWRMSDEE